MTDVQVFSSAWFAKHQRALLAVLNAPVIGGEFRSALAIRRCDIGGDTKRRIVSIQPNHYVVRNYDGSFTADFRTNAKYAKVLRHRFDAVWQAAHAWDRFVANPLVPALNTGFDTLTAFPDAGSGGTTCDGQVGRSGMTDSWATIISSAGNNVDVFSSAVHGVRVISWVVTDQWFELIRAIFTFDTSALTAQVSVPSATLSLRGQQKSDALGITPDLDIYTATPASNNTLVAADYLQIGSTSQTGSPVSYANLITTGYVDFPFNDTGLGNISKTGISKFGCRNASYDVAAVSPTWGGSGLVTFWDFRTADFTGTSSDPKLVVTFFYPLEAGINCPVVRRLG